MAERSASMTAPPAAPHASGLLPQRKCACGTHAPGGGECATCRRSKAAGGMYPAPQPIAPVASHAAFGQDWTRIPLHAPEQQRSFSGGGPGATDAGEGHAEAADAGQPTGAREAGTDAGHAADAATATPAAREAATADAAAPAATPRPALGWVQQLRHAHDALWYFGGEHPSGFSIDTRLRANGFADATQLHWRIAQGADKVAFHGPASGAEVVLDSIEGSTRANDVSLEVSEGTGAGAPVFVGRLTVRKPHHLVREARTAHAACPPWGGCAAACPAWWDEFTYRVKDNVGGTIVGATVNENFPGAKTNDQPNNWPNPAAFATVPFWANTNGTFVDNWFIACGNPAPLAPGTPNAGQSVDRLPHEFWVGSRTPAHGVRVQRHVAHRYRSFAEHENVVTPAP